MSSEDKAKTVRANTWVCANHLRNTVLRHLTKVDRACLASALQDSLKQFKPADRITPDITSMLRAMAKEFGSTGGGNSLYAKGHGILFVTWALVHHPDSIIYMVTRIDLGIRMDMEWRAAASAYMNRKLFLLFLEYHADCSPEPNKLVDNLRTVLSCEEVVAALRARAAVYLHIVEPLVFLTNSKRAGLNPTTMCLVLDQLFDFFGLLASDGMMLFDPALNVFAGLAAHPETRGAHGALVEWRQKWRARKGRSVDGKTRHPINVLLSNEIIEPSDPDNTASIELAVQIAQRYGEAGCTALLANASEHLSAAADGEGGARAFGNLSAQDKLDVQHTDTNSDSAERAFSMFSHAIKTNPNACIQAAIGRAQHMNNGNVQRAADRASSARCQREKSGQSCPATSLLGHLPEKQQRSLIEAARLRGQQTCKEYTGDVVEQRKTTVAAKEAKRQHELDLTVKRHAKRCELVGRIGHLSTKEQLDAAIAGKPRGQQIEVLKDQFRLRLVYGWEQFKTPFSSKKDKRVGTFEDLMTKFEAMIDDERQQQLKPPDTDEIPVLRHDDERQWLGHLTADASRLLVLSRARRDELRGQGLEAYRRAGAEAEEQRQRRLDQHACHQPQEPPLVDRTLVGRRIEVLTWVEEDAASDEGAEGAEGEVKHYKQWLPCVVRHWSDGSGEFTKPTADGKQRKVLKGWCFLEYDDGFTEWTKLTEFNCMSVGSWRLDLDLAPPHDATTTEDAAEPGPHCDMPEPDGEGAMDVRSTPSASCSDSESVSSAESIDSSTT